MLLNSYKDFCNKYLELKHKLNFFVYLIIILRRLG